MAYHESESKLSAYTQDMHRAIESLREELEAVDWYQQRIDAATDAELKRILAHNRDEEIEHATMIMEWIRRHNARFDEEMRTYLFKEGDLAKIEDAHNGP